jgi:hypothetical protein
MKHIVIGGLACLAIAAVAMTAQSAGGPKPEPPPKATSIAELAERYDSSRCIDCHEEIYYEWEESLHSRSVLGSPRTAPTIVTTVENGLKMFEFSGVKDDSDITVEHLMMCMKCHLPQLNEATDEVAQEIVATIRGWQQAYRESDWDKADELEETLVSLNIGCMVCHQKVALIHKYADGYPQPDTVYGGLEGDHDDEEYVNMAVAPAIGESIFCGQCHGQGPNFELDHPSQCATAYGSYLFAYVAHGGSESCQDCHMYKSELGHNMQAYRDPTMIEMALDVKVEGRSIFWRKNREEGVIPIGIIDVEIYNKTGHAIPDG